VSKTVDEVIEERYAVALISLLSSEHISIRKEALTNLLKLAAKIHESSHDEKEQLWLLLSELAETARTHIEEGPLPSHIVSFACHAWEVLKNPLHSLYAKVNTFLTSGPEWNVDKPPLVHDILQERPTNDDAYYAETSWLLSYLLDSLRGRADLALFHSKRLFERILSLASNPYMRRPLRMHILRILYRTTTIDGGSTTLVTRFGVLGWLEAQAAKWLAEDESGEIYRALLRRTWDTCNQDWVARWSSQGAKGLRGLHPAR